MLFDDDSENLYDSEVQSIPLNVSQLTQEFEKLPS